MWDEEDAYFDDDFISRTFYMEYPNDVKSGVEKGLMNIPGIGEGLAKAVK